MIYAGPCIALSVPFCKDIVRKYSRICDVSHILIAPSYVNIGCLFNNSRDKGNNLMLDAMFELDFIFGDEGSTEKKQLSKNEVVNKEKDFSKKQPVKKESEESGDKKTGFVSSEFDYLDHIRERQKVANISMKSKLGKYRKKLGHNH